MESSNKYDIPPPEILHRRAEKRPYNDADIDAAIDLVTKNARLSRNDSNLLRYYAKCKEHSTPALALVRRETGIPDEKGWRRSRRKLEQLSLITYLNAGEGDHFIMVNWSVICGLALLEEPLKVGGKKHSNFRESPIKKALDNIVRQSHLSKEELFATANILSLLDATDLEKIASATIPKPRELHLF